MTIANYQKNVKGEEELVITDLNVIVRGYHDVPMEREDIATYKYSKKRLQLARTSRRGRFGMIRRDIEERRRKALAKADNNTHKS